MSVAEESVRRVPMSWEEYLALPERPRVEWADGVGVMIPQPSVEHQWVSRQLANVLEQHLPRLFVIEAYNQRLGSGRVRIPDIGGFAVRPTGVFVDDLPELVVEILSPSTRSEDLLRKAPEYAEAGIGQFWMVDLEARWLEVSGNVEGRWELLASFDARDPTGEVEVPGHGAVVIRLDEVLPD